MSKQVARLVSSSFGLVAFALAIAVGLSVGNPTDAILSRALIALIVASIAGYCAGLVCEHLVRIATAKIERRADEIVAEEEEALYQALHPDRHGHGATGGGHASDQPAAAIATAGSADGASASAGGRGDKSKTGSRASAASTGGTAPPSVVVGAGAGS
ncbi:MAG: hypothetical protein JNL80_08370 [Phycisphaerae bacterium]|nr:hypothetical protein [Phycisphaerae bacterium]